MDVQLTVGLIVGGAATFTSLLLIGIQIIFYTKSFEEEYNEKVERIKLKIKTEIDEFILNLISEKLKELLPIFKKNQGNKKISSKHLLKQIDDELIRVHELDELLESTYKHNKWSHFMVDCKRKIRTIGICIILIGLSVMAFSAISIYLQTLEIFVFLLFIFFFLGMFIYGHIDEYRKNLKEVDETYERLQSGLDV